MRKVALAPGETKTVRFTLSARLRLLEHAIQGWHVESGAFGIQIGRSSRDIVLEKDVTVVSTVALPRRVTLNSIFMDLMTAPETEKLMRPLVDSAMGIFRGEGDETTPEEAVTPEMEQAMLGYMPLRAMLSFADGKVTYEQLNELVDRLNENR